jgi:hypothetical protein
MKSPARWTMRATTRVPEPPVAPMTAGPEARSPEASSVGKEA